MQSVQLLSKVALLQSVELSLKTALLKSVELSSKVAFAKVTNVSHFWCARPCFWREASSETAILMLQEA